MNKNEQLVKNESIPGSVMLYVFPFISCLLPCDIFFLSFQVLKSCHCVVFMGPWFLLEKHKMKQNFSKSNTEVYDSIIEAFESLEDLQSIHLFPRGELLNKNLQRIFPTLTCCIPLNTKFIFQISKSNSPQRYSTPPGYTGRIIEEKYFRTKLLYISSQECSTLFSVASEFF